MAGALPTIGSSGNWKLKAPFDTKLLPSISYSCQAIRLLSEVVGSGRDVYAEDYEPNGIPQADYDQHVADGISIITLISAVGAVVNVPSPYLDGWPSSDVVPYVVMAAVVTLGALPNTVDPSFLTPILKNTVMNALGYDPDVEYVTVSDVTNILFSNHTALEAARKANIQDNNTDYVRRLKAEADLVSARATIAALQKFIKDSGVPIPVVPG